MDDRLRDEVRKEIAAEEKKRRRKRRGNVQGAGCLLVMIALALGFLASATVPLPVLAGLLLVGLAVMVVGLFV